MVRVRYNPGRLILLALVHNLMGPFLVCLASELPVWPTETVPESDHLRASVDEQIEKSLLNSSLATSGKIDATDYEGSVRELPGRDELRNETVWLDELVSRFLDSNRDAVTGQNGALDSAISRVADPDVSVSTNELPANHRPRETNNELATLISTQEPVAYLLSQGQAQKQLLDGQESSNNNNDDQNDDDEDAYEYDRHIQYDRVKPVQTNDSAQPSESTINEDGQKLGHYRLRPNESSLMDTMTILMVNDHRPQQYPASKANESTVVRSRDGASDSSQANSSTSEQPLATNSSSARLTNSANVQARSMSGAGSPGSPARSRPPYATPDQFQRTHDQHSEPSNGGESGQAGDQPRVADKRVDGFENSAKELASGEREKSQELKEELERERELRLAELRRQIEQKLASANQLVDLNPIPAPVASQLTHRLGGPTNLGPAEQSGLYFSNEATKLLNLYASSQTNAERNYEHSNSSGDDSLGSRIAHDFKNGSPQLINSLKNELNKYQLEMLHQKTLESVSGQLVDGNQGDNLDRKRQQLLPDPLRQVQRNSSANFAASLINVTAPMVLPLSATEAMETALANGQTPKGSLIHQVSGFVRPHGGAKPTGSSVAADQAGKVAATNSQSIYSQPANQYSPPSSTPSTLKLSAAELSDGTSNSTLLSLIAERDRMRLDGSGHFTTSRRPASSGSLASTGGGQTPAHQASGFRSPIQQLGQQLVASVAHQLSNANHHHHHHHHSQNQQQFKEPIMLPPVNLPLPSNYLAATQMLAAAASSPAGSIYAPANDYIASSTTTTATAQSRPQTTSAQTRPTSQAATSASSNTSSTTTTLSPPLSGGQTTNGFILGSATSTASGGQEISGGIVTGGGNQQQQQQQQPARRVFNLTRVEHISAECSNDLIRTVIVFNGTFKGIIYSSGYVRDPNCMYINGTGKTRYDFSIRLNQCGTLGRQEIHPAAGSGANEIRRRDQVMWNTLSIQYNPNIEQEWDEHFRVSCEYGSDFWKTISFSPFNVETNTGSPVVFTVDPPQCQMEILRGHGMVGPRQEAISGPVTVGDPLTLLIHMKSEKAGYDILVKNCIAHDGGHQKMQLIDSNGCVVNERFISPFRGNYNDNDLKHVTLYSYLKAFRFTGSPVLYLECEIHMCQSSCPPQMCYWRRLSKRSANSTATNLIGSQSQLADQNFDTSDEDDIVRTTTTATFSWEEPTLNRTSSSGRRQARKLEPSRPASGKGRISDKVSLFQALEVRQEREPDAVPYSLAANQPSASDEVAMTATSNNNLLCYKRSQVLAYLISTISTLLVAITITIGCCWRAIGLRREERKLEEKNFATVASVFSANLSQLNGCHPYGAGRGRNRMQLEDIIACKPVR